MPGTTISLRARALQWLAAREHSRQELRDKLARWVRASALVAQATRRASDESASPGPGDDAQGSLDDIDALLDQLARDGLLSDARFVESRVHARSGRFGNRRIEHELKHRGVAPSTDLRQHLQRSEFERAREVWLKRFGRPGAKAAPTGQGAEGRAGDAAEDGAERGPERSTERNFDAAEKARQMRFLAARGFTPETIRKVLDTRRAPEAG
ncbi:MAG: hypothetical protein RL014_1566, partial [Pseudomonadota bacterium]